MNENPRRAFLRNTGLILGGLIVAQPFRSIAQVGSGPTGSGIVPNPQLANPPNSQPLNNGIPVNPSGYRQPDAPLPSTPQTINNGTLTNNPATMPNPNGSMTNQPAYNYNNQPQSVPATSTNNFYNATPGYNPGAVTNPYFGNGFYSNGYFYQ